ncbi:MAG: S41 family peptidase [Verrucomicrobiota bacterium]
MKLMNMFAFLLSASLSAHAAAEPSFREVYDLLRTQLKGVTEQQLDQAALAGLLERFKGRVILGTTAPTDTNAPVLPKATVYDSSYAYLRLNRVEAGAAETVIKAWENLATTNRLKGLVLDLRFARGTDFAAAGAVADLFFSDERSLLSWAGENARSHAKTNAIKGPVMILVNQGTMGAPEALAAALRENRTGLILGTNTAGQAAVLQEFKLANGQTIRIASALVQVGEGQPLETRGVRPDILVRISPEEEIAFFQDEFRLPNQPLAAVGNTSTNRTARARINEAELVRMRREGKDPDQEDSAATKIANPAKLVRDPVLARALDLLKGLAIVQPTKP